MTAQASEPGNDRDLDGEVREERSLFSYQGSKVPLAVVGLWLAFFVWGLVYLVRWIPESWREWFSR